MDKIEFSTLIEAVKKNKGFTYIDAILHVMEYCEDEIDVYNVKRYIDNTLKQKIWEEAKRLKYIGQEFRKHNFFDISTILG